MTQLATKINTYFTPERRQAANRLLALVGVLVVAVQPTMSKTVESWTQVAYGVASVFMLIIAAIVTRSPQWPVIYTGIAALLTALVGVSVLSPEIANSTSRMVFLVIQAIPSFLILARINTADPVGSVDGTLVVTPPGEPNLMLYPDGSSLPA